MRSTCSSLRSLIRGIAGEAATESVAIHTSFLSDIQTALNRGDRVFLALASKFLEREMVYYVLIRHPDGTHTFAGRCAYVSIEVMKHSLGDRFDQVLDQLVGMTNPTKIHALLGDMP